MRPKLVRGSATAGECLTRLGEVSGSDVTTVDDLLARLIDDVIYHNGPEHAAGIGAMCEALALLRPRIPVDVLVSLCGVLASLVRSFAADLGDSLLTDGDAPLFFKCNFAGQRNRAGRERPARRRCLAALRSR
jgi:hypothetical protein